MEEGQAEAGGGGQCDPYSVSSSGRVCMRVCGVRACARALQDQSKSPLQQPLQTLGAVTKK